MSGRMASNLSASRWSLQSPAVQSCPHTQTRPPLDLGPLTRMQLPAGPRELVGDRGSVSHRFLRGFEEEPLG